MRKVHPGIQALRYECVVCKLFAIVKCHRMAPGPVRPEQLNDCMADQTGRLEVNLPGKAVSGLSLYQSNYRSFVCFANDGVAFPVTEPAFFVHHCEALFDTYPPLDAAAPLACAAIVLFPGFLAMQVAGQIASCGLVFQDVLITTFAALAKLCFSQSRIAICPGIGLDAKALEHSPNAAVRTAWRCGAGFGATKLSRLLQWLCSLSRKRCI